LKIYIDSPRGKEKLVEQFSKYGEVVKTLTTDVELIIPTVDETLPFFANAKMWMLKQDVRVMVNNEDVIYLLRDKAEFYRMCKRHGFSVVPTMQEDLIAKPRFGKGGKGLIHLDRSYIVQPIINFPEYSVDYFGDWQGNTVSIIPRLRLHVVDGESQDAQIAYHDPIMDTCRRLGNDLRLVGHNVIQGFFTGREFILSEVNPRFGGGSHFTFTAFDSPRWLCDSVTEGESNVQTAPSSTGM
jgi:carbamoyl-phosphate synthase large subunit